MTDTKMFGNSHSLYLVNDEIKNRKFQNEVHTICFEFSAKPCLRVKTVHSILFWRFLLYFFTNPENCYHCLIIIIRL